jgi:AraC-like DNA-binding protein
LQKVINAVPLIQNDMQSIQSVRKKTCLGGFMVLALPHRTNFVRSTKDLDEWNRIVDSVFDGGTVEAPSNQFDAELSVCSFSHFRAMRVRAQKSKVQRWATSEAQTQSGSVLLHLQASGTSLNTQAGVSTMVGTGEGVLCDADRRYMVQFPAKYDMFVLEMPITDIIGRIPGFDLERSRGCGLNAHRSKLLISFLQTAWDQKDALYDDVDWLDTVSRICMDLAVGSIATSSSCDIENVNPQLKHDVVQHVILHLKDPDLRTSSIARALGVSPRTIQNIFERMSTTASGFILELRLTAIARQLENTSRRQSITALAYDYGFADSAYLSRCFRKRFGISPRAYR